jgi:hypothetical protein
VRRRAIRPARAVLLAVALATVLAAGAVAYWTSTGSGTATTVLPDPLPLAFGPGTPTAQLHPGGDANVAIVVDNPNGFFLHISSLSQATNQGAPFAVDAGHSACDVSVLSFVTQNNAGRGWRVPPKVAAADGTLTIDMPSAMLMGTTAASACQGAAFTVQLTAAA